MGRSRKKKISDGTSTRGREGEAIAYNTYTTQYTMGAHHEKGAKGCHFLHQNQPRPRPGEPREAQPQPTAPSRFALKASASRLPNCCQAVDCGENGARKARMGLRLVRSAACRRRGPSWKDSTTCHLDVPTAGMQEPLAGRHGVAKVQPQEIHRHRVTGGCLSGTEQREEAYTTCLRSSGQPRASREACRLAGRDPGMVDRRWWPGPAKRRGALGRDSIEAMEQP